MSEPLPFQTYPLAFSHADPAHPKYLIRSCLDSPVTGQPGLSTGQPVLVSGWLFSLKPELRGLSVYCSVDNGSWQLTESLQRPDVDTQFKLNGGKPGDEPSQFGFQIRVVAHQSISLATYLDGHWIRLHSVALHAQAYAEFYSVSLKHFVSTGASTPGPLLAPLDKSPLETHIDRWVQRIQVFSEHNVLHGKENLPSEIAGCFEKFRLYVRTHQNLHDLVSDPKVPTMLHPLRQTLCEAVGGATFDWHSCYVRFSDGQDSVYVLQKVSAIDAVFIPSHNFLFKFQHADGLNLGRLLTSIVRNLLHQSTHKYPSEFLGFNVGHQRPAHLVQDVLPGVAYLEEHNLLRPEVKWCTQTGGDYIDLAACFPGASKALNYSEQLQPGQYMHQMGAPMVYHRPGKFQPEFYDRLFQRMVAMALFVERDSTPQRLLSNGRNFLLWLGVSAQKRLWLNQVEGLAKVIELFQFHFPNLIVAFDGWTAPFNPLPNDLVEIQRDGDVVQQVLNRCSIKPSHITLVGSTVSQKIAVAKYCNFYLTSALTGSVWVSRALKNKGLLHISNPLREIAEHHLANPNAILVESKWIKEINADKAPRFDCINYEIDLNGLMDAIKSSSPEFKWNN